MPAIFASFAYFCTKNAHISPAIANNVIIISVSKTVPKFIFVFDEDKYI